MSSDFRKHLPIKWIVIGAVCVGCVSGGAAYAANVVGGNATAPATRWSSRATA